MPASAATARVVREAAASAPAAKRVNTDGEKRRLAKPSRMKNSCQQNRRKQRNHKRNPHDSAHPTSSLAIPARPKKPISRPKSVLDGLEVADASSTSLRQCSPTHRALVTVSHSCRRGANIGNRTSTMHATQFSSIDADLRGWPHLHALASAKALSAKADCPRSLSRKDQRRAPDQSVRRRTGPSNDV